MNNLKQKTRLAARRVHRVRAKLHGTAQQPRLAVHISHRHVSAQLIDDDAGKTLAHATTVGAKQTGNLTDQATWVGGQIAAKALKLKTKNVVLDRGSRKYHGRVKALADAARAAGMEF